MQILEMLTGKTTLHFALRRVEELKSQGYGNVIFDIENFAIIEE